MQTATAAGPDTAAHVLHHRLVYLETRGQQRVLHGRARNGPHPSGGTHNWHRSPAANRAVTRVGSFGRRSAGLVGRFEGLAPVVGERQQCDGVGPAWNSMVPWRWAVRDELPDRPARPLSDQAADARAANMTVSRASTRYAKRLSVCVHVVTRCGWSLLTSRDLAWRPWPRRQVSGLTRQPGSGQRLAAWRRCACGVVLLPAPG